MTPKQWSKIQVGDTLVNKKAPATALEVTNRWIDSGHVTLEVKTVMGVFKLTEPQCGNYQQVYPQTLLKFDPKGER